jgi:outer membrane protein
VKHHQAFVAFSCLLIALAGATVHAQALKIGYVNSAKVLQEFPEAMEAQQKLDQIGKKWQSELEGMDKTFQDKYQEFQKKEALLNDQEKRTQRDDLLQLQQKGLQYRQQKFGAEGELALMTDSLLRPIKQKVMKVIEQVARDQKLQFMFDRNEQILVLLYGESKFDYTNLVIDRLKRGGSSLK